MINPRSVFFCPHLVLRSLRRWPLRRHVQLRQEENAMNRIATCLALALAPLVMSYTAAPSSVSAEAEDTCAVLFRDGGRTQVLVGTDMAQKGRGYTNCVFVRLHDFVAERGCVVHIRTIECFPIVSGTPLAAEHERLKEIARKRP